MTPSHPLLRPELASLTSYNAGLTHADVAKRCGHHAIAKLGSNENPRGYPAEATAAAMMAAIRDAHLYPDPSARPLAEQLGEQLGVPPSRIIIGNGSEDLLSILARTILRPGDAVVTLYPSFPLHEDYARMMGARITRVDLTPERTIDVDALLAAAARPVRMTILANPMNPTGLWLSPNSLDALLEAQHPNSLLCLDEAYVEYALGDDYLAGTERLASHDKPLLILRTFSKAYGLAGLRVGYGLSNSDTLIQGMNLTRTPFNVNAVAQAAALAALGQPEHMRTGVTETLRERDRMATALSELGLAPLPSKGNFLFLDCGRPSAEVAERLLDKGVIIKPWKQAGYETFLRVSVGLPEENTQFLDALAETLP